ncbi:52 kDa repressor of the inhibitor of the protein kinase, putative [Perkinsus marinus ATCC 50983]|uniref:52 kDa repressor of the inhibitor of the protein kinase, putative n=1 Tax=Perkinsus marinus (strain ATCC 50983 / TXsc) TaxID=423536 RepID=C5KV20_PERM5|nr:52 kDa repressor of the inhibitor of the protein kinase, putative [Perkinsus marinus ATCC 50983]EER11735.1 52 kDa repressor of the inhibitor of the protein kinase, putative [Perkinsus marinus ATCC 50983]|eukprot:XP_002779940.1 52 kDa repressor of the inhibitor of the protein kinase, putative [Perkinsus marinus ATCC 50983]
MSKRQIPITGFLAKRPRTGAPENTEPKPQESHEDAKSSSDSASDGEAGNGNEETTAPTASVPLNSMDPECDKSSVGVPGLSLLKRDGPTQPKCCFDKVGGRAFVAAWYKKFPWIEYSEATKRAYCYPCRFFRKIPSRTWCIDGFAHYRKSERIAAHGASEEHKAAMEAWSHYRTERSTGETVATRLGEAARATVLANRRRILYCLQVVLFCAIQGIALRGHSEDRADPDDKTNSGNFLGILKLVASHSQAHRELFEGPRNSRYLSPKVQNELLHLGSQWVRKKISDSVSDSKYFALICDESRDNSKTEQLCITVRYLRPVSSPNSTSSAPLELAESILMTSACEALTSDFLTELIYRGLVENNISVANCVSTSFDGAASFSGSKAGVQKLLRDRYAPLSIHVHCLAHRANLVLTSVCREIQSIPLLFDTLQEVYIFISSAAVHPQWMNVQRRMYPHEPPRELRALSETRWNARYESANIMWLRLKGIYELLDLIIDNDVPDRRAKADALSQRLDGTFIIGLSMMRWVLQIMSAFTIEMQKVDFNLSDAISRAVDLDKLLQRPKVGEPDEIWEDVIVGPAKDMCEELEVDFIPQRPIRRVRADHGPRCEADYRSIFIKVCDALHREMQDRFLGEERQALYDGLDALNPAMGDKFLQASPLIRMAQHFKIISDESCAVSGLLAEVRTLRDSLNRVDGKPASLMTLLHFLNQREPIFHNVFQLARVCATIPVSSAQCERGFSGVRRVKNFMRSNMAHARLSDLIVLHLNRELASQINEEQVVDNYRDAAERRVKL